MLKKKVTILSLKSQNKTVYFDNAATSFPKPPGVTGEVMRYMTETGANPGRSGHRLAVEAGELVLSARFALGELFGQENPMRVLLGFNATDALNLAIQGVLCRGGHAITTAMEHNSTIRPLRELEKCGIIDLTVLPCDEKGAIDPDDLKKNITPDTVMAVVNHGSNVFGTLQPAREIGKICRDHEIIFLLDAAQTGGTVPLDLEEDNIDLLAFTGHKGLYGATGTGGLVMKESFEMTRMRPLRYGGTGSLSDKTDQPDFLPDRFESGTLNVAGLAGLAAGIEFVMEKGIGEVIAPHKKKLVTRFINAARKEVPGFKDYVDPEHIATGTVSFNIGTMESSETARILSDDYNIMCRAGLHCAPLAHQTMGSFPDGTVRFSFSIFNTEEEIDLAITALRETGERHG